MKRVLETNETMNIKPVIELDSYGRFNRVAYELLSFYIFNKKGEQYFPKVRDEQLKTKAEKQQKQAYGIIQLDRDGKSNEKAVENIIDSIDFFLSVDIDVYIEAKERGFKSVKNLLKDLFENLQNNSLYIQVKKEKRKVYNLIEVNKDGSERVSYKTTKLDNLLNYIFIDLKTKQNTL